MLEVECFDRFLGNGFSEQAVVVCISRCSVGPVGKSIQKKHPTKLGVSVPSKGLEPSRPNGH